MQQIADWLEKLGLGQYAQRFAENDITFGILPHLTDQDLKELGVTSLGHRRQLLLAIAEIRSVQKEPAPHDTAERRQVTVLFSDLVGSTALSARMDPEDLRELISAYHKCVAEAVRRFGGFVAQYLGDGVLVYFGYPEAHEDDAERAVRAGLELIEAISALKTPASLQARVGIATGLVVVGDLMTGSGQAHERGIVGETPNFAARLQGIAEPNTVVIAEATRRLLGNLFELVDLGARDLKGVAEPLRAWVALRASTVESRFEALHPSELTALVGRAEETELLLRRWSRVKSGEGQVVLISGEAGIGKSRLTAALLESLASEPHTRLRYFGSPQHTDSAFYPVIRQMEREAGLLHDDTAEQKLDKLDALLAQTSTSIQDAALTAEMLALPNDGRYPALELTPQQRRQKTMEALTARIETLSRQQPVLMIFEDAHWADPTSFEAFGRVVDRIRTLKVLLLVTLRPDFDAPWVERPYVTALIINRLAEHEAGAMIDRIVGNKQLSESIRHDIIARTDGIPLFLEEMTKAILEAESETAAERAIAAVPSPTPAVPASLHASLMARLDRLGTAREIAQIGSVIGREFTYELIRAVAAAQSMLEGSELQSTLRRLTDAELIYRRGRPLLSTYVFKHALVRDAAYSMLVRSRREELHTAIGRALEEGFPGTVESEPELLAYHYGQAERNPTNIIKALNYLSVARERARSRSALNEAVSHIQRALQLNAILPEDESRRRQQLELQIALVGTLQQQKGYAHPDVFAACAKTLSLLNDVSDPEMHLAVHYLLFAAHYVGGQSTKMLDDAKAFLAIARQQQESTPTATGHRVLGSRLVGTAHLITGNIGEAITKLHEALAGYDRIEHAPTSPVGQTLRARFVQDVGVTIDSYLSWALWLSGQLDQVAQHADAALAKGRQSRHTTSLFYALWHAGVAYVLLRDSEQVERLGSELIKLADEHELEYWQALGDFLRGWHSTQRGQAPVAIALLERGLQRWKNTGAQAFRPILLSFLASAYAAAQQPEHARRNLEEALKVAEDTGERWATPEIYRLLADLSVHDNPAAALEQYERAISLANVQASPSFELRATTSWARVMSERRNTSNVSNRLLKIYGRFNQELDTPDLMDAKALLKRLSTQSGQGPQIDH